MVPNDNHQVAIQHELPKSRKNHKEFEELCSLRQNLKRKLNSEKSKNIPADKMEKITDHLNNLKELKKKLADFREKFECKIDWLIMENPCTLQSLYSFELENITEWTRSNRKHAGCPYTATEQDLILNSVMANYIVEQLQKFRSELGIIEQFIQQLDMQNTAPLVASSYQTLLSPISVSVKLQVNSAGNVNVDLQVQNLANEAAATLESKEDDEPLCVIIHSY